jgi:hypothetical protein
MNSSLHHQTSDNRLPEDVLRKFIADLKDPIAVVEKSLHDLSKLATQADDEEIFSQLGQATRRVNENIQSVLDYLHLKLKTGLIETDGEIALEILGRFSHVLRESSAPLMGFISVAQQCELSEAELEHNTDTIKNYGKHLVRDFRLLDSNWRIWLETRKLDWEVSDS